MHAHTNGHPTWKERSIEIRGARQNNLQNIDLDIPQNKLVVITGVSGSGKSSLAFDTLFAEGQRRYIESLSAYVRQFVGKIEKPEVDSIRGLSPAIAIQQKVNTTNPRSTVGTTTEVYDYLKLLYARIGQTLSPMSGNEVKRHSVSDVIDAVNAYPGGTKLVVMAPLVREQGRNAADELSTARQKGFTRVMVKDRVMKIEEVMGFLEHGNGKGKTRTHAVEVLPMFEQLRLVIDRLAVDKGNKEYEERLADSVQTSFNEGGGVCMVYVYEGEQPTMLLFSNKFELDGMEFEEPSTNLFTFNNPYGACKTCEGFGTVIGIDEDKVVPDKNLSVYADAVVCWRGEKMQEWKRDFLLQAGKLGFPIHRPYMDLSEQERGLLWNGQGHCEGISQFFQYLESNAYKIQYRVLMSRYRGKTNCPDCRGTRLRKDAAYVKVGLKSISDLVLMPIDELCVFFMGLELDAHRLTVSKRILLEIQNRLQMLCEVGLGYLTLNRDARTLSGGESQRIQLVTSLGSNLTGSMYILDEPSIGLHSKDTEKLIAVLKRLRDLRNTVIVVEHDEDIIRHADHIIDIGPLAGNQGGRVVFSGPKSVFDTQNDTLTAKYMNGEMGIVPPAKKATPEHMLQIVRAFKHNLKGFDVQIPLFRLTVVTGVSGSGKSTLVREVVYPSLLAKVQHMGDEIKNCADITGSTLRIKQVEYVDQNPIGRSSRSNPVTYIKAYDPIRILFAQQGLSKQRGYTPAHFSFNVDGGRCDACQGDGYLTVEMQFMADLHLKCEECAGKRFKPELLDVTYKGKNIWEVLDMTVDEGVGFFSDKPEIHRRLSILQEIGLGYLGLGQSSSTLSGGEAQRIKLAYFLAEGQKGTSIFFFFDEPTTGLHVHDIKHLLTAFHKLLAQGHTVLVIEHNLEVIKCADWLIDLGPEGGKNGGQLLYQGLPTGILGVKQSHTAKYLATKLK
ncbi:MAG: excinuclease ABC subunit UvrA [Bacteroidetes bacterium]|nr:excinuclease ABC subunit UvrA [Bacteroidota bacterium]